MAKAASEEPKVQAIVMFHVALKDRPEGVTIQKGDILLASDPAAKACPRYVVPWGSTTTDVHAAIVGIAPPPPAQD